MIWWVVEYVVCLTVVLAFNYGAHINDCEDK